METNFDIGNALLTIDAKCIPAVNYSLQQNEIPLISEIRISNQSESDYDQIDVTCSFSPTFATQSGRISISLSAADEKVIRNIPIKVDGDYLAALTERISGSITVILKDGDIELCRYEEKVNLLAFDECFGFWFMPELLSCFSQPNHPDIAKILLSASKLLGGWTGDPSLDGYQSEDPNRIRTQAAAIYGALQECNITYATAPAGFEKDGQRVRTADVILREHLGNCLDLSLLFIACLEAAGLHPVLIIEQGHAFAGVWLTEQCFPEIVGDDLALLSKRTASGISDICLVEMTSICAGQQVDFEKAQQTAEINLISKPFEMVVDIKRARAMGILPLPRRELQESGYKIIHEERSKDELTMRPGNVSVVDVGVFGGEKEFTKFDVWQRKLLDLTKRNALINMRLTRNMLPVLTYRLNQLEDALFDKKDFRLLPKSDTWKIDIDSDNLFELATRLGAYEQALQLDFEGGDIRIPYTQGELQKSITQLYRKSRADMEENGANTLYLAMGALKWYETETSSRAYYAPLVLIPVDIIRKSARVGYVIRRRDDEAQLNITLLEMLRQNYNTEIQGLDPLPQDEHGLDMTKVLAIARQGIMHKPRWDVVESAFLGNFSFAQFVMWNDLRNRTEDLKCNKIVSSLVKSQLSFTPNPIAGELCESEILLPISADSSQLRAIDAAAKGKSFVLHGPPGTGKSQTITSMIANSLAQGKTVLFVAQKMAALSVVKKRLDQIGIGPFCLELHSNKANKKAVLDQLESVLKLAGTVLQSEYEQTANTIAPLKSELDAHKMALHKEYPFGVSLYEAISSYEHYAAAPDLVRFHTVDIKQITPNQIRENELIVDELISAARIIGHPHDHPLLGVGLADYSQQSRADADVAITEFSASLHHLEVCAKALEEQQSVEFDGSVSQLQALYQIATTLITIDDALKQQKDLESSMQTAYTTAVFDLPLVELMRLWRAGENTWFFPRLKLHGAVKKQIAPCYTQGKLDKQKIVDCLKILEQREKLIGERAKMISELPSALQNSPETANENAKTYITACNQCKEKYNLVEAALQPITEFKNLSTLESIFTALAKWQSNLSILRDYCVWNFTVQKAMTNDLSPLVTALVEGLALNVAKDAYYRGLYQAMAETIFGEDENNSRFNGTLFNEKVASFKRLDEELRKQARREILMRLSSKLPNLQILASQNSEVGILQRAIRNGGRGIAIRKLLEQLPTLLSRLCPCMLMSPISVAQYIDPKRPPFDIVIFDEASQMPTCEAVGVIARAKEAVIVGDPKQMPPTSFFATNIIDEEHQELEDLESILDDCLALSMPETHLKWHYRSRHESLIAFSNREFYGNDLYTFPSPDAMCSMVKWVLVEGYYDRGKTRQNAAEASAIVKEIEHRLETGKQSIGVVTFSVVQQSLVEDLLNDLFIRRPDLDALANECEEPLFVKNLENVQGDERDIILFSVCYGPDQNGAVSMNFGPLNREGGWRRLNVAITRAREEMMIFSVLKPDQFDMSRTSAAGVRSLKAFLEYAQNNSGTARSVGKSSRDGIAASIAAKLTEKGYLADTLVGFSHFRVDVGVRASSDRDKYALGILLDGDSYHQAQTVYDREVSSGSVLGGLGWRVMRVYAIDWWEDSEREISRIILALENDDNIDEIPPSVPQEQISETCNPKIDSAVNNPVFTVNTIARQIMSAETPKCYAVTQLPYTPMNADLFLTVNDALIRQHCLAVLQTEAPIAESLLVRRVLSAFGISRAGSRVSAKIMVVARSLGFSRVKEETSYVYYESSPQEYRGFRLAETDEAKRDVKDLPMAEIDNAIKAVLIQQYGLPHADLMREAAKILGYSRIGSYVEHAMKSGIDRLIKNGSAQQSESGNITLNQ